MQGGITYVESGPRLTSLSKREKPDDAAGGRELRRRWVWPWRRIGFAEPGRTLTGQERVGDRPVIVNTKDSLTSGKQGTCRQSGEPGH